MTSATRTSLFLCLLLFLAACDRAPKPTPPAAPLAGATAQPSIAATATATAAPSATGISLPTATDPATATPTITLTPQPIASPTASPTPYTPPLYAQLNFQPIGDQLAGAANIQWSADGRSLVFSRGDSQWPGYVRFLPTYQRWWDYDLNSNTLQALPPRQSRVSNEVRQSLGLCPYPLPDTLPYPCSTLLFESDAGDRIVFGRLSGAGDAWLADGDGTELVHLEQIHELQGVIWSGRGDWLLLATYAGGDGDHTNNYHLVSADGLFVAGLEPLTNTSHYRILGPKPAFSPDGSKLAFMAVDVAGLRYQGRSDPTRFLDDEESYNLFVLDLGTFALEVVNLRFGLFHWADDGQGFYILDGSATTEGHEVEYLLSDEVHFADLYFVDLSDPAYPEQKLAENIPIHLPYFGAWAYSPAARALAGSFVFGDELFGVLSLGND